jgi:hypothetical protein
MTKRITWGWWLAGLAVLAVYTYASIMRGQWHITVASSAYLIGLPPSSVESEARSFATKLDSTVPTSAYQLFFPLVMVPLVEGTTGSLRYVDETNRFSFTYPASFAQSPLQAAGCNITLQPAQGDGWHLAEAGGDWLLTFGHSIYLQTIPAQGRSLAHFVEQFIQELGEIQFQSRDDERFNREPRGYVVVASYQHHYNPHVFFQQDDTFYLFHARMRQACIDTATGVDMLSAFWQAAESFRFSQQ